MSDMVGNPENRFSRVAAYMNLISTIYDKGYNEPSHGKISMIQLGFTQSYRALICFVV